MKKKTFCEIETFMLECLGDSAHDLQHIYRVLYTAIIIAQKDSRRFYRNLLEEIDVAEEGKNAFKKRIK